MRPEGMNQREGQKALDELKANVHRAHADKWYNWRHWRVQLEWYQLCRGSLEGFNIPEPPQQDPALQKKSKAASQAAAPASPPEPVSGPAEQPVPTGDPQGSAQSGSAEPVATAPAADSALPAAPPPVG